MSLGQTLEVFWAVFQSIVSSIQEWFSAIWSSASNIVNTGQGLFTGLIAIASALWDAIQKFGQWIYNALTAALTYLYNGIKYWADIFGQWFNAAMSWVGSGISWIGAQLYNFGQWIWNGIMYIAQYVGNALTGVWNAIVGFFSSLSTAFWGWWNAVATGINNWWTGIILGIRNKIKHSIMASITISSAWRAGEKLIDKFSEVNSIRGAISTVGGGLLGMFGSLFVGYILGELVDGLIPTPSTSSFQLIPTLTAPTIPSFEMTITPPSIPTPPTPGFPTTGIPTPPGIGYGLPYDVSLTMPRVSSDTTISSRDLEPPPPTLSYDTTMDTSDGTLSTPTLSYETKVS